jgi:hypothetical protein
MPGGPRKGAPVKCDISSERPRGARSRRNLDATASTSELIDYVISGLKEEPRKGREEFESCRKALRDDKQRRN